MMRTAVRLMTAVIPFRETRRRVRRKWLRRFALQRPREYAIPKNEKPYIAWKESPEPASIPELSKYARDEYSQFGEDGILERIFSVLGEGGKRGVEFGAWDGKNFSNLFNLVRNRGWHALMIEGSAERFADLEKTAAESEGRITPVQGFVGVNRHPTLDSYLAKFPGEIDVLSIDVDGIDYYIWESLKSVRPRVVVVEYNFAVPPDVIFIQAKNESVFEGASAAAFVELGREKGYSLAAVTQSNLIFVDDAEFPRLGIGDNSLEALWTNAPRRSIFYCPNGRIYTVGLDSLFWQRDEIEPWALQLYDKFMWGDEPE